MERAGTLLVCVTVAWLVSVAGVGADPVPAEYQAVLTKLGKSGDYKENTLKINLPRDDLRVTVAGVPVPTAFGFGGWLAMTKGEGGMDMMMGDLVLLQDEVNPVMSALLDHGLQVTALHNHFFWERPRVFFMHVHGQGMPADLAGRVKPAVALLDSFRAKHMHGAKPPGPTATSGLNATALDQIVGHQGDQFGAVHKITIGRDDIELTEMGAKIGTRMGLNTWAAFFGTDDKAVMGGDIAMLEGEVNPVLIALRKHGLNVVAIHQHMIGSRPMIIFLHYWGSGKAPDLARGFRAALDELGKHPPSMAQ